MAAIIPSPAINTFAKPHVLAMNVGSSSIKFALFEVGDSYRRMLHGGIEAIGSPQAVLQVKCLSEANNYSRPLAVATRAGAIEAFMDWIEAENTFGPLAAVGHRVVHGGPNYSQPVQITSQVIEELHRLSPFDPEHLQAELLLIEAFRSRLPHVTQVACFDTAFHHNLPRVAQILPIPRRYEAKGVRRYGFHGLSYAFLLEELARQSGPQASQGRVILAHLGNGASLAAVHRGQAIDTSMSFTPTAGVPMSTRSGDLDPALAWYLARTEGMTPEQFNTMVNSQSGLLGVSETSSDMRDLLQYEADDIRAAEAVSMFCYQIKKCIGSFAAALGGVDTLVFAGGIGENSPAIRWRICDGLEFLGIELEESSNTNSAAVISTNASRATVRVIRTNEEITIARSVVSIIGLQG